MQTARTESTAQFARKITNIRCRRHGLCETLLVWSQLAPREGHREVWSSILPCTVRDRRHQDQLRSRVVGDGPPEMSEVTVDAGVAGAVHTPVEQDTATVEASQEPGSEPQEPEQSISRSPSSDSHVRSSVSDSQVRRYPSRHRKPRERFEPGKN